MTWEEWCASDYNPFNENVQGKSYRCTVAGCVVPALGPKIVVYNGVEVTKTDVIIANAAYSLINV